MCRNRAIAPVSAQKMSCWGGGLRGFGVEGDLVALCFELSDGSAAYAFIGVFAQGFGSGVLVKLAGGQDPVAGDEYLVSDGHHGDLLAAAPGDLAEQLREVGVPGAGRRPGALDER